MKINKLFLTLTAVIFWGNTLLAAVAPPKTEQLKAMLEAVETGKDFTDAMNLLNERYQKDVEGSEELKNLIVGMAGTYDLEASKLNLDWALPEKLQPDESISKVKVPPIKGEGKDGNKVRSLWSLFVEGFGWGFVALLTPCVFPMIPMTVSFFTKQSGSRSKGVMNALLYGFFIVIIYVSLGLLITIASGKPATVYGMSTNVYVNMAFFAIFMIFAFSFLGAFEIRMPSSWVNKVDSKADRGGLVGIFFMAFTLALVSFSCTGPIIGSSLVQALSSGAMGGPAVIMLGFSIALALPFMLFAVFPGWLNSLPQSGGWLNSVKVVLGLLEIALALKFFSMVDLAYHWDILTREIFVAIWVVVFGVMGFYLLGKLKFAHDSDVEKLSVTRFMFAFFALVFTVYLIPGMWGAPLHIIDGVAPPKTHSEDKFRFVKGYEPEPTDDTFLKYREYMHEVGDGSILVFHEMEKARAYAREVNRPILVDFTGHSCANCRKTESNVWTNDKISPILKNKLVIVSLYCDDRTELPEAEQVYSEALRGKVKNIGNKWSAYQIERYGQLSQPLYIIQDVEGNDLTPAIGYTPDIDEYQSFLERGISKFTGENTSNNH